MAQGSEIDLLFGINYKVVHLGGVPSVIDKGYMNWAQKRGSLAWFERGERFEIMMSGMSMSGPSARLQGAPVVAMTATILDAGSARANGPDDTPSATFYEPPHVPLVNVDVLVGEDEEDRDK